MKSLFFTILTLTVLALPASAQFGGSSNNVVNYKVTNDEPYGLNKLWLHFQPMVADVFMTNLTLGYGIQADFLLSDKIFLRGSYRGAYGNLGDLAKNSAERNGSLLFNDTKLPITTSFFSYTNVELGGTYHIRDDEVQGNTKITLTSKRRSSMQYENVDYIIVTSKVRKTKGVRAGLIGYSSTFNLSEAYEKQDVRTASASTSLTNYSLDLNDVDNRLYSNVAAYGLYVGGSYSVIRNVSIKADRYGDLANNIFFDAYFDISVAPYLRITDPEAQLLGTTDMVKVDASNLKVNYVGWRAGFDIKYNQDRYWAFGGEMGMRPGIRGRAFYVCAKIGLPVLAFQFANLRPSTDTGGFQF